MSIDLTTWRVPRFTVRQLLSITALIALSLVPWVLWGWAGALGLAWLVAIGVLIVRSEYAEAAVMLLVGVLMMALIFPAPQYAKNAGKRGWCTNNMRNITLAVLAYESVHGHLPPPYSLDADGNPLHSWRVLILPYLEERELYRAIDLEKPWHHPHNLALADQMPEVYRCPGSAATTPALDVTTSYVVIVGDNTAWPRSGLADISKAREETLAIIDTERHRLHWMSTADPAIEMLGPIDGDGKTLLSGGPHEGGVFCSFLDGHVRFVPADTDFRELRTKAFVASAGNRSDAAEAE